MKKILLLLAFVVSLLMFVSCKKEPLPPVPIPIVYTIKTTVDQNVIVDKASFSVNKGDNATVTASTNTGYIVDAVSIDGTSLSIADNLTAYSYTFSSVNTNHSISITSKKVFVSPTYSVNIKTSPNVTYTTTISTTEIKSGSDMTINFTTPIGYDVDTVLVDGVKASLTNKAYKFLNIIANHNITVTSKINERFKILTEPRAWVEDSVSVKEIDNTWSSYKSEARDSIFFYPDLKIDIYQKGKLVGNGNWSLSGAKSDTILFNGKYGYTILYLGENLMKTSTKSQTNSGLSPEDNIKTVFIRP